MGVVLCGGLPISIRVVVTPHGKTVEAPYSKLGPSCAGASQFGSAWEDGGSTGLEVAAAEASGRTRLRTNRTEC
jgi:hypothetical protein